MAFHSETLKREGQLIPFFKMSFSVPRGYEIHVTCSECVSKFLLAVWRNEHISYSSSTGSLQSVCEIL